ncbi:mCG60993 [Mus musculus]|nr:mCG60993 [Mus musculus]
MNKLQAAAALQEKPFEKIQHVAMENIPLKECIEVAGLTECLPSSLQGICNEMGEGNRLCGNH